MIYLQKKSITHKEIHADMVLTLADSTSYATVKKKDAEFKRGNGNTDDEPRSGCP